MSVFKGEKRAILTGSNHFGTRLESIDSCPPSTVNKIESTRCHVRKFTWKMNKKSFDNSSTNKKIDSF
jgi:hypothetical protein